MAGVGILGVATLEALAVGKVAVEMDAVMVVVTGEVLAAGAQVEIMVAGDKEVVDLDSDLVVADRGEGALEVVEDLAAAVEVETEVVAASLL